MSSLWFAALVAALSAGSACDDLPGPIPDATAQLVYVSDCAQVSQSIPVTWNVGVPPVNLTIGAGDVVRFHTTDGDHSLTSGVDGKPEMLFDVMLEPGHDVCIRFSVAAVYPFFCRIHPEMTGTITVP